MVEQAQIMQNVELELMKPNVHRPIVTDVVQASCAIPEENGGGMLDVYMLGILLPRDFSFTKQAVGELVREIQLACASGHGTRSQEYEPQ